MKISSINQGIDTDGLLIKETILCQPEFAAQISSSWFKPEFYGDYARPVSQGGRNAAWFIDTTQASLTKSKKAQAVVHSAQSLPHLQAVLRQYRRGGMVAKVSRRHYVWNGAEQTRSWLELRLLQIMYNAGLPVPKPLAAYYKQSLGLYKAAILTQTIPNSQTLVGLLQASQDKGAKGEKFLNKLAGRVAKAIHELHEFDVSHADLNAYNILVDADDKVWLIDFDKSIYHPKEQDWRQNNLLRLQRHLIKTCDEAGLAFWSQINEKYQNF